MPSSTKVSVVRDKETGKSFTGISGNPHQKADSGLSQYLLRRVQNHGE